MENGRWEIQRKQELAIEIDQSSMTSVQVAGFPDEPGKINLIPILPHPEWAGTGKKVKDQRSFGP